jgi:eukaryotic-like serine/threonine-protein kinase
VIVKPLGAAGVRLVEVGGTIGDDFDERSIAALARGAGPIVFDLDGVRRITSTGVRNWIAALRTLGELPYYLIRCRPALVCQFNMVAGFGVSGRLISFYLPYLCPACNLEFEVLLDLRTDHAVAVAAEPPATSCTACGKPAEFDDDEYGYFSYAGEQGPPQVPTAVAALIDAGTKTANVPLKIRKEITDRLTALWLSGTVHENARFKRLLDGSDGTVVAVAQEVRGVTITGLARLLDALARGAVDLHLARVPVDMAAAIASLPRAPEVPIVSLWVELICARCDARAERELAGPARPLDGGLPPCPRCGGPRQSGEPREVIEAARRLELATAPAAVAAFLSRRPGPPSGGDAADRQRQARMSTMPLETLLLDGYEIERRLGVGGMAEVLLARQVGPEGFHKQVAIKRILPQFVSDPAFVELFLREARTAASISHANVVQIYDLRRSGSDFVIVMEYVPGWNLDDVLKAAARVDARVPVEIACRMISDVCAGLHAAHTACDEGGAPLGIVHRDVSPHNVLLARSGAVKLTDFGLAKATHGSSTQTDGFKGKLLYVAPERLKGHDSDPRSDVYAAGLILHLCLTGAHPLQGDSHHDTIDMVLNAVVAPPSSLRAGVPPELDAIVARAVARRVEDRYPTAQAMQLALEGLLARLGRTTTSVDVAAWLARRFAEPAARGDEATAPSEPTLAGSRGKRTW